jgi:hypothetical protein
MHLWRPWGADTLSSKSTSYAWQRVSTDEESDYGSKPTDSLLEHEVGGEKITRRHSWSRWRTISNLAQYFFLAATVTGNFVLLILVVVGRIRITLVDSARLPPTSKSAATCAFGILPISHIIAVAAETPTVFHPSIPYSIFAEDHGAAAWKRLTENFDIGAAYVPNHKKHGLFDSELKSSISGYEMYPVAMYHQLHCLASIVVQLNEWQTDRVHRALSDRYFIH